jgi:type I restriction enzyme, R subunit
LIISDGLEAKTGSLSADLSRFMAWKSADGQAEASHLVSQLETLINGMLNRATLLDLVSISSSLKNPKKKIRKPA